MGARLPILLPYGLSVEHQSFIRADTKTPKQHGPLRFRNASLSELLAPSRSHAQASPALAASITTSVTHQHLRITKSKKSATGSRKNDPRIGMAPDNSREKYHRSRKRLKPSTSASKTSKNGSVSRRQTRNALNMGANLRLGASHDMPIMLDSNSGESVTSVSPDVGLRNARSPVSPAIFAIHLDQSRYRHQDPSAWSRQRRSVTPVQNSYVSSGFSFRKSSPAHTLYLPKVSSSESETPLIPKSTARRRESVCTTPHSIMGNAPKNLSKISRHRHAIDQKDMSLLDIDDFVLRSKVAQLMAVAPALPIIDLYHLVIDSEGCMTQAKKRARAMSEAPCASRVFTQSTFGCSRKIVGDDDDENSEDVMIKIDPGNPTFEWDDDEPVLVPDTVLKACPRSNITNKTTDCSHSPLPKRLKRTKTSETSSHSRTKHSKVPLPKRTSTRETSSDRDFIVADNVTEYVLDSDESHELGIARYTTGKKRASRRRKYSMI